MPKLYTYPEFYLKAFSQMTNDAATIRLFTEQCPEGDILEIGGGSGRTLGFFTSRKHILLESDPEMIQILNRKINEYPHAVILNGRCPSIPAHDQSIAGVFAAFGTMGEINPICTTLQEIERVLIPGGSALLSLLNPLTYCSPPLGIYRSNFSKIDDLSFVANTLPNAILGAGEFQTHVWVRQPGFNQHFTIQQYFPTLNQWLILIEQAGLTLINEDTPEALNKSQVFSFLLKKSESKTIVNKKTIEVIYDTVGTNYDQFISKAQYGVSDWLAPHLKRLSKLHPRIIDLACGNGYVGRLISDNEISCSELLGYDISAVMVKECQKSGSYSNVCRFDLNSGLPGVGGLTTDIVTAFGLMEFLPDPSSVLQDIRRILVLGGELLCSFEATDPGSNDDQVEMSFDGRTVVRYRYSQQSIEQRLTEIGLSKITIERRQGYRSPTTGQSVDYLFVHAVRERL
ncbi:class I SAM-dependent methyltransferase [Bdellovibrionota bacterium FG-1]